MFFDYELSWVIGWTSSSSYSFLSIITLIVPSALFLGWSSVMTFSLNFRGLFPEAGLYYAKFSYNYYIIAWCYSLSGLFYSYYFSFLSSFSSFYVFLCSIAFSSIWRSFFFYMSFIFLSLSYYSSYYFYVFFCYSYICYYYSSDFYSAY